MDLNVQMWSQLNVQVPNVYLKGCWKLLYGRKTYIGRFHMLRSTAGLIAGPKSPKIKFARMIQKEFEKVYVHWHKDQAQPVLKNDMDFPPVVKSGFFRSFMGRKGHSPAFVPYCNLRRREADH